MKKTRYLIVITAIAVIIGSCLFSCSPKNDGDDTPPVEVTKPSVQTLSVNRSVNYDSVLVTGKIIDDGNSKITACGIKCGTYNDGAKMIEVTPKDSGVFTVKIPIKFGVTYGFCAYGTNKAGTSYGSTLYYSYSANKPVISETSVTEVNENSGVALDTVDNGKLPTRVTILFGKTSAYTDSVVINTINQVTTFKFLLRNLEAGSEYHFRFKAENILDTVYTSDRIFCTGVKDIDGNLYPVIKIGNQFWIAKNLMTTHYNDGSSIVNPISSADWVSTGNSKIGAYCWYNNDPEIGKIYGGLYNWYAIATGKLAIKGWHVPTYDEWMTMNIANYRNLHVTTDGCLKETGFDHWKSPNLGATNATGFTALPNGGRYYTASPDDGVLRFSDLHVSAVWWTADEFIDGFTRILYMDYNKTDCYNDHCDRNMYGLGVRLVKDSE